MKLSDLPLGVIDWLTLPQTIDRGESGTAVSRTRSFGEIRLRLVAYGPGYVADHWCGKGHILHVVAGSLAIEHADGTTNELGPGMTWHVADEAFPPHRVVCERGATVFIVD